MAEVKQQGLGCPFAHEGLSNCPLFFHLECKHISDGPNKEPNQDGVRGESYFQVTYLIIEAVRLLKCVLGSFLSKCGLESGCGNQVMYG